MTPTRRQARLHAQYERLRRAREGRYAEFVARAGQAGDAILAELVAVLADATDGLALLRGRARIAAKYQALLALATRAIGPGVLEPAYAGGLELTHHTLRRAGRNGKRVTGFPAELQRESVVRFTRAIEGSRGFADEFLRSLAADFNRDPTAVRNQIAAAVARTKQLGPRATLEAITRELRPHASVRTRARLAKLSEGKVLRLETRRGPIHMRAEAYAHLRARTDGAAAQTRGTIDQCLAYGVELVRISWHNTATLICKPHERQVYSLTGQHPRFPPLASTPRGGTPFHDFCIHGIIPELDEVA
jgi:hypothetical protein